SLATARYLPTATLLPNGKVLVVGGNDTSGVSLASAELYDPASGTWTATGSLGDARSDHTATLLPNGEVLVAGGTNGTDGVVTSEELYDPASGTWTATGSRGDRPAAVALARARNRTIRSAGLGRRPAASATHALITRHPCRPTAGLS